MAIIHVDESTPGLPNAGRLSGTNGDLVGIMDIALPLNGWAIEYTSGNARVYRPGTGNRFRLHMNDDSAASGNAGLCVVRGCENASNATTLVDPFPTVSRVADTSANWVKSSAANTTARLFDIWVGETFVIYAVNWSGSTNMWELHMFGDFAPSLAGDSYNTFCTVRNSSNPFGNAIWTGTTGFIANATGGSSGFWICRSYDGTVKSVRGGYTAKLNQSLLGVVSPSLNTAQNGPTSGIDTEKMVIYDSGSGSGTVSGTLALPIRGWIPNLLSPQNGGSGSLSTRYSYTESPYMTTGKVVTSSNGGASGFAVVQESDDWVPPS